MSPATTVLEEQAAIVGRINSQWSDTPVAWENTDYDPTQGEPYLEPRINRQQAFNSDMGPTKNVRYPGLLTGNIRTPLNKGAGPALTLAETFAALFRNVAVDGLHFRAPTIRPVGPDPSNDAWYLVQVDCPYWRDTIY